MRRPRRFVAAALASALLVLPLARSQAGDQRQALDALRLDRYYDVEALEQTLRRLADAFPERTRLSSMGKSREGRELWVLRVFDPSGGDPENRPCFYVEGNTHGNEVQGAEVCVCLLRRLLLPQSGRERELLRRVTFHVAPTVNPDARHRFFHTPQSLHSPRGLLRPTDDDGDGLLDEDGPDDLDGDGHILEMRVLDENGTHVVDERDRRLLRTHKPGEPGRYRLLGVEGRDDDGDGRWNEDGPGAVDPNRNFPGNWRPERDQPGAGPYPLSEPETRAVALWLMDCPHLAGVQSFHNAGRMILRPPGAFTDAEAGVPRSDVALYRELQRRGLLVLPTYRAWQIREDLYRVYGGLLDWLFFDRGIFAFSNELWGHFRAVLPKGGGEVELLEWNDHVLGGEGFVDWHAVEHPDLGTVEVGGWKRFTLRSNPPVFLAEECERNALFVLQHAEALPDIRLEATPAAGAGAIDIVVRNLALLPTINEMARRQDTLPPDRLTVLGASLSAAIRLRAGTTPLPLETQGDTVLLPEGMGGGETLRLRLFVQGTPKSIRLRSRIGGTHSTPVGR